MAKNYSFKYKNSKGTVIWIHKNSDTVIWIHFDFKKRVKCKLLKLLKTEGRINSTVKQFLNDNGLILIKTHQLKEFNNFNIIDKKEEVEEMDNKKIIKVLKKEIIELFNKNNKRVIINSLGFKYFDFYTFDDFTKKYIRCKINFRNATFRKFKNDSNYYPIEYSNEILQNIINIYDTIVK